MHQNLSSIRQECHHGLLISTMRGGCRDDLQSLKSNYTDGDAPLLQEEHQEDGAKVRLKRSGTGSLIVLYFSD